MNDNYSNLEISTNKIKAFFDNPITEELDEISTVAIASKFVTKTERNDSDTLKPRNADQCSVIRASTHNPAIDIDMLDLYDSLTFENQDGGVWKQGFSIKYNSRKDWTPDNPLNIFIVPHSHNDPGWHKTFLEYYDTETKYILDYMVEYLTTEPRMKFIYAEISFFSHWWNSTTNEKRAAVKKLTEEGRLEFVNGGWVMNDEANTHYSAMVGQMIQGNVWLHNHLGIKPKHGWFIDPFGHSPVNAYILKSFGLESTLIQRVHYFVKKTLALSKSLEFYWRQNWDFVGSNDILCHMMPFYFYDIPHTCGPDPKVCCQFDFYRLPNTGISCPWNVAPQSISASNVRERANLLLDQYRKKSQLYQTNNLLVPLGDDFRYKTRKEWTYQMENYLQIMDYLNNHPQYNAKIKFATLSEYFEAIKQATTTKNDANSKEKSVKRFPVLRGDFFTYADKDNDYWSGYYTSRPKYKRMERILEYKLRAAEIFYSLAIVTYQSQPTIRDHLEIFYPLLDTARNDLGLFQHHDGITGTARHHVVEDYAFRMLRAIKISERILDSSLNLLLDSSSSNFLNGAEQLIIVSGNETEKSKIFIYFDPEKEQDSKIFYLVNSLAQERQELYTLRVNIKEVCLLDPATKQVIKAQINPEFKFDPFAGLSTTEELRAFELVFKVTLPALSATPYEIKREQSCLLSSQTSLAGIDVWNRGGRIYNRLLGDLKRNGFKVGFKSPTHEGADAFSIYNSDVKLMFDSSTALLQKYITQTRTITSRLKFSYYEAKESTSQTSGAYIFMPETEAKELNPVRDPQKSFIAVMRGPLESKVLTRFPLIYDNIQKSSNKDDDYEDNYQDNSMGSLSYLTHKVSLWNVGVDDAISQNDILHIENDIYMASSTDANKEIVMRIDTDIRNQKRYFYTDNNGFQIQKRRFLDKLPIQANFYPMPTSSFIEDDSYNGDKVRMTLLTAQPLGVGSLHLGSLEVIMDRKFSQDDNRGLGEVMADNEPYTNKFKLVFEISSSKSVSSDPRIPFMDLKPTIDHTWLLNYKAWHASARLLHPAILRSSDSDSAKKGYNIMKTLKAPAIGNVGNGDYLPANSHLVNLITLRLRDPHMENFDDPVSRFPLSVGFIFHTTLYDCDYRMDTSKISYKIDLSRLLPSRSNFKHIYATNLAFTSEKISYSKLYSDTSNGSDYIIALKPFELQAYKAIFYI
ncbi:alpha-mannosidase 2-like [Gordionus sp. m RMFG-2023]|uniref:alpha-mannosidase 2-like n=1 Tax=Gordionus sp. m RMFG-2023 TaxID=3053472 RepID=UPI0031FBF586